MESNVLEHFMQSCLTLAEKGRWKVGNGAMVGAVLVRENTIIAQGYHERFGGKHAERVLLDEFPQEVRPDDVLFVNLEPCCHTGKQPPCTKFLIERGVKRVVIGMSDPDPRVSGKGIKELRAAGIEVIGPVMRAECEYFNRGFITVRTKGRPWITLKQAKTGDGSIANVDGSPLKITDAEQDSWSHTFLRSRHDAILVGAQTVINDNPRLDIRLAQRNTDREGLKQNYRIILDPQFRIPGSAKVLTDGNAGRTIVVVDKDAEIDRQNKGIAEGRGVRFVKVPRNDHEFDLKSLFTELLTPHDEYVGITSILVEGGAKTWNLFRVAGVVDEEVTLVSKA
jgi:diaminohydroxyphosphoribosylaminopyrimidine deaminase/5-amino-6-(5-phosphoribosylamino)uracil reductase